MRDPLRNSLCASSGDRIPRCLSRCCLVALVFSLLAFSLPREALTAADDPTPPLRYHWKAGQTYAYFVTVEVDQGDYLDILSGTPTYTVVKTDADGTKLTFHGTLKEKQQAKPGKRIIVRRGRGSPFSPFTGVGPGIRGGSELTVNDRGEILSAQGSSQLPYLLGNLSQLMLAPLPKVGERSWKVSTDIVISLAEGRLPRPGLRDDDRKQLKAVKETSFAIEQATKEEVTIARRYELKTGETVGGKPRFEIVGDGKLSFDLKAGVPGKLEFQQKLVIREGTTTEETPIKITFKLLDESERAKLAEAAERPPVVPAEPLTEAQQTEVLADLKSGDKGRCRKAMLLLQKQDSAKPNPEIAAALEAFLTDKDQLQRLSASKALTKWATTDTVAALVKALDDSNVLVRHNVMDALGRLKAEAAAEPIAQKLASQQDRIKASPALQAMGAVAEPAVLKQVENNEWMVRMEVCKILKVIGTQKSVPALTKLQDDPQALVKLLAKQALDAIAARK